jgi:hypothetical protein
MSNNENPNKRVCIFCGASGLTKEHVWPKWAEPLLKPNISVPRNDENWIGTPGNLLRKLVSRREIPESTVEKQTRVVCGSCNNGWMSIIEEGSKDILTLLIQGIACELDLIAQRRIANWVTLKMMVAEQNEGNNSVTTFDQRTAFKNQRTIPERMNIYLAQCGTDGWESACLRNVHTISDSPDDRPVGPNIHSMTMGIGQVLVHAAHSTSPVLNPQLAVNIDGLVLQVWPIKMPLVRWPPKRALAYIEARTLATTLSRLSSSPNVR